ncbi:MULTISPECIES: FtsX-like permease family protein [unclassified Enterococcus]|uniref:ABC transporter permease n=1 Tax=unclassified Enterococcus TaxID=2608891 RepID=UPI0015565D02|nr:MULTISPECIES: FtsX-like permease family protein [unclassified Enterococcus]MBS7577329.1 FtsX-like permease family protein [Enterococcus sp. MMGLQ5-2]MBS7584578.1 FtsX-like permease family protein [Enterococcus sp. MMGLQ5-1]NPD12433.1 FtsX-like permease family protein [Enterococcus sp. MMGLQ5-1]NPD37163.1 FtsX-like permease family protein [Enterococcus sp. MMGLQ5-2]
MDFFRRAWLSLKAKKGRTTLLILVFSAILIFVLAGLTIRSSANQSIEAAKKSTGATVSLSINRDALMKARTNESSSDSTSTTETPTMPTISLATAEKIAALDGVKSYNYATSTTALAVSNITAIVTEDSSDATTSSSESAENSGGPQGEMGGGSQMMEMNSGDFQITGTNSTETSSDFTDGTSKITSGRGITSEDKDTNNVVISEDLAEDNSLSVGDKFTISDTDSTASIEVTIVGIYSTSAQVDDMMMRNATMNPVNEIYGYLTLANTIKGSDDTDTISAATYNLEDPNELDSFVEKANKLIDTDQLQLQTNDEMYQQMLKPLNNVASFATNIVWLVSIAGIIILSLIVIMIIRERRYEIGVLLSLGEGKFKVIMQFFSELVVVMVVAVGIAAVSGNFVGNIVGQQLLDQQTTAQTESSTTADNSQQGPGGQGGGFGQQIGQGLGINQTSAQTQAIDELDVKLSPKEIGFLGLIALAISIVATLLASLGILRMQPKDILSV